MGVSIFSLFEQRAGIKMSQLLLQHPLLSHLLLRQDTQIDLILMQYQHPMFKILFLSVAVALSHHYCVGGADLKPDLHPNSPHRVGPLIGLDLSRQYDAINAVLEKKTESDEPEVNFDKLRHWLKSWRFNKLCIETQKAAKLILSLAEVNNRPNQCSLKSYNILYANFNAANGLHEWNHEKSYSNNRITKVLRKIINQHAYGCFRRYFDLYREQVKLIEPEVKQFVENLFKDLIIESYGEEKGRYLLSSESELLNFIKVYPMTSLVIISPNYWLNQLRRLSSENSPDNNYMGKSFPIHGKDLLPRNNEDKVFVRKVDKLKLKFLFDKHIHKPCSEFMLKLETIFKPIDFDTRTLQMPAEKGELDFYLNWATFELCDATILYKDIVIEKMAHYEDKIVALEKLN